MTPRRLLPWLLLAGLACEAGAASPARSSRTVVAPAPQAAPAPSPPAVQPAAQPVRGLRQAAGVDYLELLHVAPGTPPDRAPGPDAELPMIVAIHGRGDDPDGFKDLLDGLPVHARVIVPRAFDALPDGGWSWFPIRARSADVEALARGIDAAGDRLAGLIGELSTTRPTRGRAIVTGFSQGGMLSFSLATDHPDLIAAAVPVGGWLPPPLYPPALPTGRLPTIFALHGEVDQVVRHGPTRDAVDHLARQGWPAQLQSFPEVAHQIPAPVRRELYVQLQRAVEALP